MFFVLGILGGLLPIALVVLVIAAFTAGRSEPDPRNERPKAIYLSAMVFIGLFVALIGAFMTVSSAVSFSDDHDSGGWSGFSESGPDFTESYSVEIGPDGEEIEVPSDEESFFPMEYKDDNHDETSSLIMGLITLAIGLGILRFDESQLRELGAKAGVAKAVYTRHLYLVCFTAIAIALGALGFVAYSVYGAIAPDWAGLADRAAAGRQLASSAVLAVGALVIFRRHWQFAEALNTPEAPPEPPVPPTTPTPLTPPTPPVAKKAPTKKVAAKKVAAKKVAAKKAAAKKAAAKKAATR